MHESARRFRYGVAGAAVMAIGLAGLACDEGVVLGPTEDSDAVEIAFGRDRSDFAGADWRLTDASVEGDTLVLEVQHAGGCARHGYRVVAVQGFLTLPSLGPISTVGVPLTVVHDDGGDACEALLTRTLRHDLSPLEAAYRSRMSPTGPARLLLRIPVARGADEIRTVDWEI